ncbi:hypothetical protein BZG42_07950 [Streptococcus sp. DAT741]|nr:hypothetical protein BZG42_07950 [Streptococcus sp. DAT741]
MYRYTVELISFHALCILFFVRFLDVRFSKRYFLKIELIQDIETVHRQFRLVMRSKRLSPVIL